MARSLLCLISLQNKWKTDAVVGRVQTTKQIYTVSFANAFNLKNLKMSQVEHCIGQIIAVCVYILAHTKHTEQVEKFNFQLSLSVAYL